MRSRRKGRDAEQELARLLRDELDVDIHRNWQAQSAEGGHDLVGVLDYAVEVKRYASATYGDLERWWSQACTQCPEGLRPVLAYREDRAPWRFVLAYSALSGQGPHPPYGLTVEMSLAAFVGLVQRRPDKGEDLLSLLRKTNALESL